MGYVEDLTGRRFDKLLVEGYAGNVPGKVSNWHCRCDCGNELIVSRTSLMIKGNHSCQSCKMKRIWERKNHHGESKTRLYSIYRSMKRRCYDNNAISYNKYGGRGIKVCEEWQEYEPFSEWAKNNGYTDELTLDRIDNNGDYNPDNCRWATYKEQALNTRTNHFIEFCGEIKTLSQWADELGINRSTLCERINSRGWSIEKALTTTAGKGGC